MTFDAFKQAIARERFPAAIIDLDALDKNIDALLAPVRMHGKKLRVATKSLRCPDLIKHIVDRGGDAIVGLMTYDAAETAFLAELGYNDLLLAYPSVHAGDLSQLAQAQIAGANVMVIVDCIAHVDALDAAARRDEIKMRAVIDVDVAYRPLGSNVHLGVRRSPLRTLDQVRAIANAITSRDHVELTGVMAYEAHIAGLPDIDANAPWSGWAKRAMKLRARNDVVATRKMIADSLSPALFNGGGSGSLAWCCEESALTEITAGSGFVDSHLFDNYRDLALSPAAFFALQVVRMPAPDIATCHGGGFIASGSAGADRLPIVAMPEGVTLTSMEGAGEVQTPLQLARPGQLGVGDPVFFRHAKAGELAEHFNEYLFVRGDRIVHRAKTYRGLGHCFLG